jgi:hypothetical protein
MHATRSSGDGWPALPLDQPATLDGLTPAGLRGELPRSSATGPRGRRRRPRSLHVATPRPRLVHTPPSRGTVGVPAAPPRAETRRRRRRRTRATRAEHGVQCARLQENICPRKHYSTFISVNVGPTKPGPQPQSSFPVSRGHAVVVLRRPASTAQTPAPLEPARPSSPSPSPSSSPSPSPPSAGVGARIPVWTGHGGRRARLTRGGKGPSTLARLGITIPGDFSPPGMAFRFA